MLVYVTGTSLCHVLTNFLRVFAFSGDGGEDVGGDIGRVVAGAWAAAGVLELV